MIRSLAQLSRAFGTCVSAPVSQHAHEGSRGVQMFIGSHIWHEFIRASTHSLTHARILTPHFKGYKGHHV